MPAFKPFSKQNVQLMCRQWDSASPSRTGPNNFLQRFVLTAALVLCSMLLPSGNCRAITPFRIGTGGETGVYYPIGTLIATGLTRQGQEEGSILNGLIGVAQNSAGSIENVRGVLAGELEAGLVQADIAAYAFNGKPPFDRSTPATSLRALASLYPEKFQIVVRKDAGIHTFQDLRGKKISIDEQGSGTLAVMRIVLAAHGMTESDLLPLYLKPVFTYSKIISNQLQGFVIMAGAPMEAVTQLYDTGVTLIPLEPEKISSIYKKYPYLYPGKIPANTYNGIAETPSLEVYALLVVDEKMPEEIAYAITEALFNDETSRILRTGHPQGKAITLETALNGLSIPLHPGAERFYRNRKLLE